MKKFSKINNIKISDEPIELSEETLESKIKKSLLSIMERILKVQSTGSVDNRFLAGNIKVDGKELLAEAIIDFFDNLSNNKEINILEALKGEVKDWETIDKKINEIKNSKKNYLNKFKLNNLLERYKSDKDLLKLIINEKIKVSSSEYKKLIYMTMKENIK